MALFPGSPYLYLVIATVNIVAFLTGTSIGWSSPILGILLGDDLSKNPLDRKITDQEVSWVGSLAAMGGIFGPIIFGFLVEKVGRKTSIAAISLPFLTAYAISAFAEVVELFYVARILMGMGVGGTFTVVPIYVVETAETANRGFLQAVTTSSIMLGILFSYCVGPYVSVMAFNLILLGICVVFLPVFWFVVPETPYFLLYKKKEQQAIHSLSSIRRTSIDQEFDGIKLYVNQLQVGSFLDIFETRATVKAFLYGAALTTFQQLSGVTVILYFTENIFNASGSDLAPEISSIIVGASQFLVSVTSPPFLDRVGRKLLLAIAVGGAIVAETLLGVYFYLQKNGNDVSNLGWLPVFSLTLFIAFYNFGIGSIPWAVMSELLPMKIIAKASYTITSFYWLVGFFLTKYFGDLTVSVGMAGSFWLFAGFCVMFELFILVFMFETKGKSLKEIQEILNK